MVCKLLPKLKMKWHVNSLRKSFRASIFANFSRGLKSTLRVTLGFTWIVDRTVKLRLHYLLRTIISEESLKVNGGSNPFIKSNHSRWRMKEVAHGQIIFALDESSKVNNVKKKVSMHDPPPWTMRASFVCRLFDLKWKDDTIVPTFLQQFP